MGFTPTYVCFFELPITTHGAPTIPASLLPIWRIPLDRLESILYLLRFAESRHATFVLLASRSLDITPLVTPPRSFTASPASSSISCSPDCSSNLAFPGTTKSHPRRLKNTFLWVVSPLPLSQRLPSPPLLPPITRTFTRGCSSNVTFLGATKSLQYHRLQTTYSCEGRRPPSPESSILSPAFASIDIPPD
jgi:hypothetical protein